MVINIVFERLQLKRGSDMEPNEEQKDKLLKLKKKCFKRCAIATFLYVSWLFCANMITAMVNIMYVHNESFVFFMTLGTTVVIFTGLHGTVEEIYKETVEEAKKLTNEVPK